MNKAGGSFTRRVSIHTFPRRCHWKHQGTCTGDSMNCPTTTCECVAISPWVISHWLGCNSWLNQLKKGVSVSQLTLSYSARIQSIVTKKEPWQGQGAGAALRLYSRSREFGCCCCSSRLFPSYSVHNPSPWNGTPNSGWAFPPWLTPSRNSPADKPKVCLLGESRFCWIDNQY